MESLTPQQPRCSIKFNFIDSDSDSELEIGYSCTFTPVQDGLKLPNSSTEFFTDKLRQVTFSTEKVSRSNSTENEFMTRSYSSKNLQLDLLVSN